MATLTEQYKSLQNRKPDKDSPSTPIEEIVKNGEPVEVVRKKIVYEYRPLYTLAFVICFIMLVWAIAYTIEQISDNKTAQVCFNSGGSWLINEQGARECRKSTSLAR